VPLLSEVSSPPSRGYAHPIENTLTIWGMLALTLKHQTVLTSPVPAPDRCHPRGRTGSVKVVFACTFTRQLGGCGWPAVTDGLDGF
jgi:hypothetical protein